MHDDQYAYRVSWSPEDGEFVATVVEFRTLSWLAPDPAAALLALRALAIEAAEQAVSLDRLVSAKVAS